MNDALQNRDPGFAYLSNRGPGSALALTRSLVRDTRLSLRSRFCAKPLRMRGPQPSSTLFHSGRLKGNLAQTGHAVGGKQRHPQHHRAKAGADSRNSDVEPAPARRPAPQETVLIGLRLTNAL